MNHLPFSRRDFLKLSGAGMLGVFLAELHLERARAAPATQGRMALSGINLYSDPSFNANKLHIFGRDEVVKITAEVDGDAGNPYNKKWYEINGEGYTYSGWVQPVESNYQRPVFQIPSAGQLGEITVPLSDTHTDPSMWSETGYRVYFGTTHWVTGVTVNRYEKGIWYEIYDSHLQKSYYVPASDMRLVPDGELILLSPDVPEERKHIYVDTATQSVTAFEDDQAVLTARCSSGGKGTKTPLGDFQTFHKGPTIHMTNDGEAGAGHGYDLPGVPWVSFFTGTGVSFHGTYWHNDYGQPRSHGCVNLSPSDAKFVYRWTRPNVPRETQYLYEPGQGTRVQIVSSNL
ncbi:MAG TPA: L,D-transpeptidase family protein [Anaerolineales bacterium]|jgi:lipoprotein-anchoring transpeptidase ErfK/SrfK|nr:L,D-transpeptidase family protein [Anaerolineales bacterium]